MKVIPNNENTANLLFDLREKIQGRPFDSYTIERTGSKITIELKENINVGDWVRIDIYENHNGKRVKISEYGRVKIVGKIYVELEFRIVGERRYFNELCYFWHRNDIQKLNSIGVQRMENLCKKHRWCERWSIT